MKTYIDWITIREKEWPYGSFMNVSFNPERLMQYANEKWWANITISKRRDTGQYGETHYATLNEWKPEWEKKLSVDKQDIPEISIEDLPFR